MTEERPISKPQHRFIKGIPYSHNHSPSKQKKLAQWKQRIVDSTADMQPITGTCNIDVTFYLDEGKQYMPINEFHGPDIDNLQKAFLDGLSESILLKKDKMNHTDNPSARKGINDCRITGIRAIKQPAHYNEPGVFFKIIPTYTLKIIDVSQVDGEALKKLNPEWQHSMQAIEACVVDIDEEGNEIDGKPTIYVDNAVNQLFILPDFKDMDSFDKSYSQINPGFPWEAHKGKTLRGVMIFERKKHLWINTWDCRYTPNRKEL